MVLKTERNEIYKLCGTRLGENMHPRNGNNLPMTEKLAAYAIELDRRTDIAARSRRLVGKGRQGTCDLKQMGAQGMQRTCGLGALPGKRKKSLPDGD